LKYCKLIFLLFLIVFTYKVEAQSYDFKHYSIENGLSQSVVNCISRDTDGYLWFGTQNGLNRFDGYNFKKFINDPTDKYSISDNWIFSIVQDFNNKFWFATKSGLNCYDKIDGKFTTIHFKSNSMEQLIKNDVIYGLNISHEGKILINTPPFFSIYDPRNREIQNFKTSFNYNGAILDQTLPIMEDRQGIIWIASTGGLSFYNPKSSSIQEFKLPSQNGVKDKSITALYQDSKGRIWIGRQKGIEVIEQKDLGFYLVDTRKINALIKSSFVRSITEEKNGNIWIGTEGNGLSCIRLKDNDLERADAINYRSNSDNANSLSHDIILSQWIDESNLLWIGTLQGIDRIDLKPKKFELIRKTSDHNSVDLLDNVIASVYQKGDEIWIGNWGKGLNIYHTKSRKVEKYTFEMQGERHISNNFVHVIFNDNENRIWIGTRGGISIYNPINKTFIPIKDYFSGFDLPDFSDTRVYCMLQDKKLNYWIGTSKGLYKIDLKLKQYQSFFAESNPKLRISSNLINSLFEDNLGHIWIGTANGLDEYLPDQDIFKHYYKSTSISNSLCNNYVVSLCEDDKHNIWIGTQNGVNQFIRNDSAFIYYSAAQGLPGNVVYSILMDKNKDLWFTTGSGLALMKKNTKIFRHFDIEDGLQGLEFNLNASYKASDGKIFFGGMNGVNYFHPDSLRSNNIIPPIVINNIEIINKNGKRNIELGEKKEFVLNYNDFAFNIEFSALEFTNPEKNQYAYLLENINDEWIPIGNRRFVPFSDLKEGSYVLRIKGSNNDGVWNETGISIKFTKYPPWWRTKIAFVVFGLLIILLIYFVIQIRIRALINERKHLEQQVVYRTKEIQKQKNEIEAQRDEIETQRDYTAIQRDKLKQMNDSLTDSITYAKRIQSAILPSKELLERLFKEFFVLYIPKDIISGDFYWAKEIIINNKKRIYFAVADCTGHGVPGSFVSMLGITLLNEIVSHKNDFLPAEVLNILREQVKSSFQQSWDNKNTKDGMDISLCMIEENSSQLVFAGANSRIHVLHNNELIEIAGDRMPIGIYYLEKPFANKTIDLTTGDLVYLYSDGYQDQFGGDKGLKFMRNSFSKLINEIRNYALEKQHDVFLRTLKEYQHDKYDQVDDITVLGIKI